MKWGSLPDGLLPILNNYRTHVVDAEKTEAQQLYDDIKRTRRKAFFFICSAFEECSTDVLILAKNIDIASAVARRLRWSVLKGLGWTCPECARLYHHPAGAIGPRATKKKTVWQMLKESEDSDNE